MVKIHVGKTIVKDDALKTGKRFASYTDIPDFKGWHNPSNYLPGEFDLVKVHLKSDKFKIVWHTGFTWDGLKLNDDDEILFWKICNEV